MLNYLREDKDNVVLIINNEIICYKYSLLQNIYNTRDYDEDLIELTPGIKINIRDLYVILGYDEYEYREYEYPFLKIIKNKIRDLRKPFLIKGYSLEEWKEAIKPEENESPENIKDLICYNFFYSTPSSVLEYLQKNQRDSIIFCIDGFITCESRSNFNLFKNYTDSFKQIKNDILIDSKDFDKILNGYNDNPKNPIVFYNFIKPKTPIIYNKKIKLDETLNQKFLKEFRIMKSYTIKDWKKILEE